MEVAVLHAGLGGPSSYYDDWADAFARAPGVRCRFASLRVPLPWRARRAIARAELVVLLHGCLADTVDLLDPVTPALRSRRGRLVALMGNELSTPWAPLGPRIDWLRRVEPTVVASQLPLASARVLYRGHRVVSVPHALNPAAFVPCAREGRPIDLGARGFTYPPHVIDDQRNRVLTVARRFATDRGWKQDIGTGERLDRRHWAAFLSRTAFAVSSEAGAEWVDTRDAAVRAVEPNAYAPRRSVAGQALRLVPYPAKARAYRALRPFGIRHAAMDAVGDDSLFARYRAVARPPDAVSGKCITARHLDAVGTRTVQILVQGAYNGVLERGAHYIETDADMTNADEVDDTMRDARRCERIADDALDHVLSRHTVDHRVAELLNLAGTA